MANNFREIELKFPLKNKEAVLAKLESLVGEPGQVVTQKDTYFNPPHRDFLEPEHVSEWLRIRETEKGATINYKNWHKEDNVESVKADEYETSIDEPEAMDRIFDVLQFKKLIVVEKKRQTWDYKDVEIAIDEVIDLGSFIEIEAKGNFESEEAAEKHLYDILKELGAEVGEQDFKGYPMLLLEKKGLKR